MRILCIDIETSPNLAHVWALWDQNVGLNQLIAHTEMLCFAAKWLGDKQILFYSVHHDGKDKMIQQAWSLLNQADVVMHFNGKRFDVPHLNREFLEAGKTPPAPFKQIDLLATAKKRFNFPSNKLEYLSRRLGLQGKVKHEGHELWVKCMAGDDAAWERMKRYNKQDVKLLESLYRQLQPWIPSHPNRALYQDYEGEDLCPACGSNDLKPQGFAYTSISKFQRYVCGSCGKWSRSGKRAGAVDVREAAL